MDELMRALEATLFASAEPPTVAGIAELIASRAISDALRVATGFRPSLNSLST